MEHIAELVDVTPAEVLGTASFYEMFKREPVGDYVVNVCTNISCMLLGGEELLHHLEHRLGIKAGDTTPDGKFTLEDVECIAACTEAPCLQVNYRYFHRISNDEVDVLIDDLRAGKRAHEVPAPRHAQPGPPAAPRHPGRRGAARPQRRAGVAGPQQRGRDGGRLVTDLDTTAAGDGEREIPRIVTSRWDLADGYTLDRYRETGGYDGAGQGAQRDDAGPGGRAGQGRQPARPRRRRLPGRASSGASARPACSPATSW